MRTNKCDVCGRTEPEVWCRYSREKRFAWFIKNDDSQGGSKMELDLCEDCWFGFISFMQNRFAGKSPNQAR